MSILLREANSISDGYDHSIVANVFGFPGANALAVAIVDANGKQITSFGGSGGGGDTAIVNSTTVGKTKIAVTADPITFAAPQHVIIDSASLGSVAVTGAFFPATQPVSGTVSISGSVAVTGTFWPATQPVSGSVSVSNFPATQPVSGTVAVTGTFWQATQPTSSTQLPAALDGSGSLKIHEQGTANVSVQNASLAVTGTFWQATQPVSGTVAVSGVSGSVAVTGTFWQDTQPVSLAALPALIASSAVIGHVIVDSGAVVATPPAITKGTQGSTGVTTQDLKDAGRSYITLYAQLIAGVTTEALATFTKNVNGTATASQTSYTVTAGKTFRIQSICCQVKNTTTVANSLSLNVRAAATVSASSPIVASCFAGAPNAVAGSIGNGNMIFPDGLEIAGGVQVGVSHLENVTTATITSFILVGYEY